MKRELQAIASINTTELMKFPSGKFGFVGKVPAVLLYDATTEEIKNMLSAGCAQFLKRRVWSSAEEAKAALDVVMGGAA